MLSDQELQAIADNYVQEEAAAFEATYKPLELALESSGMWVVGYPLITPDHEWEALRVCELDTPPGVYFVPCDPAALEALQGEPAVEWSRRGGGLAGFFIHRTNGEMRIITDAEEMSVPWWIGNFRMRDWDRARYMLTVVLTGSEPETKPPQPPYHHRLYLDYDLQDMADEYVRSELPQWESFDIHADWTFTLHDPPGAYFTLNPRSFKPSPHPAAYRNIPEAKSMGVFINRENGEVRHFTIREVEDSISSPETPEADPPDWGAKPDHIRYILSGAGTPHRPWWKFW